MGQEQTQISRSDTIQHGHSNAFCVRAIHQQVVFNTSDLGDLHWHEETKRQQTTRKLLSGEFPAGLLIQSFKCSSKTPTFHLRCLLRGAPPEASGLLKEPGVPDVPSSSAGISRSMTTSTNTSKWISSCIGSPFEQAHAHWRLNSPGMLMRPN